MNYLKFYNKNTIKRLQAGGAFISQITDEMKQRMSLSDYIEAKRLEHIQHETLDAGDPNKKWSDKEKSDATIRLNSLLSKYQQQTNTQPVISSTSSIQEQPLSNTQAVIDETMPNGNIPATLDSLQNYRQQGTITANTDSLHIDTKKGTLGGATLTTTDSAGNSTTREISTIKNNAFKQPSEAAIKTGQFAAEASKALVGLVGSYGGQGGMNGADAFSTGVDAALQGDVETATTGIIGGAATVAVNAVDTATMGDKNFSAGSKAIDTAVHGVSGTLMKSGNPIAMGVGAGLEVLNFVTKAGGKNVPGYDVNITNSGYGNLGHQESEAGRIWDNWNGTTARKLAKRNEQARMALAAADISENQAFEQEARMNSVDDVIQQNQIALAGGVDTSLLAAKHGAKLSQKEVIHYYQPEEIKYYIQEVVSAKNGAKLEEIEVSEDPNVIPEGALHKNKNHLDLDNITSKGIPVLTVDNPEAETFEDIKASEDSIQQHAEIEDSEIIFNKELTLFIENMRKQWHEKDNKDDSICVEAGMRLAKEIIENTEDNTDVTQKAIEAVENENN